LDAPVVESLAQAHHDGVGTEATVGALLPHSYFGCDGQILAMEGLDAISYGPGSHAYRYDSRGRGEVRQVVTGARAVVVAPLRLAERTTVCRPTWLSPPVNSWWTDACGMPTSR